MVVRTRLFHILLLLAVLPALAFLALLGWSRFIYQQGIQQMYEKEYAQAEGSFTKAENLLPKKLLWFGAAADLHRIYSELGRAQYQHAITSSEKTDSASRAYRILMQASANLAKAAELESLDYHTTYWQARTESILEYLHPRLYGDKIINPYSALHLYEKAISLRPAGVTVHYDFARYLSYRTMASRLAEVAAYLTEIYPSSYFQLKREVFFTPQLRQELKSGLLKALENETSPRNALRALSDIALKEDDPALALIYYQNSLDYRSFSTLSRDYAHLGMVLLKNRKFDESYTAFEKALRTSRDHKKTINKIYRIFKQEQFFDQFLLFSIYIEEHVGKTTSLDINVARCRMDMDQPELAKARLILSNARDPRAESYYLLAKIAEKQKNWGQMEIAIQRATVLDKENSNYFAVFASSLSRQKKYLSAEEVISKAIRHSKKENQWLFSQRAWIRWSLKNYEGAGLDWKHASAINPARAEYYYYISMTDHKREMKDAAMQTAIKALELAPENLKFVKWKQDLEKYYGR